HARPRPLDQGTDGSLPRLRSGDEPGRRRGEAHGPGRRLSGGGGDEHAVRWPSSGRRIQPIKVVMNVARSRICLGLASVALVAATGAAAADANFTAYRAHVNGICRSHTPKFKSLEADMAKAQRAGNTHRYAYDFGTILGLTLAQGV